jgi:carbamoyl-phosphate synthase large subunit
LNILITSAGRRVSLVKAFRRELRNIFPEGKIYTADMNPELSSACRVSDGFFSVAKVTDPSYSNELVEICLANNILLVVPTIDTELIPLTENVDLFEKNGIKLIASSLEMMRICRDKRILFRYFDSIKFPWTKEADIDNPVFPIFMKPIDGSSSIGSMIIRNNTQLSEKLLVKNQNIFLQYFSPDKYTEYTIDLYFDKKGNLKCAVPRERIEVRGGEVSKSVTRRDELYAKICTTFSKSSGLRGCITLQVFKQIDNNEIFGIEINPRFGGGYPLSYCAGANYPAYIIREYLLNEDIQFFDGWKSDLLMLRYDEEIIINDYKS